MNGMEGVAKQRAVPPCNDSSTFTHAIELVLSDLAPRAPSLIEDEKRETVTRKKVPRKKASLIALTRVLFIPSHSLLSIPPRCAPVSTIDSGPLVIRWSRGCSRSRGSCLCASPPNRRGSTAGTWIPTAHPARKAARQSSRRRTFFWRPRRWLPSGRLGSGPAFR